MPRLGNDLYDIAIPQAVLERHNAAVHLGAHAMMTDLGVDGVSEVDGVASRGKTMTFPLGVKVYTSPGRGQSSGWRGIHRVAHFLLPLDEWAARRSAPHPAA